MSLEKFQNKINNSRKRTDKLEHQLAKYKTLMSMSDSENRKRIRNEERVRYGSNTNGNSPDEDQIITILKEISQELIDMDESKFHKNTFWDDIRPLANMLRKGFIDKKIPEIIEKIYRREISEIEYNKLDSMEDSLFHDINLIRKAYGLGSEYDVNGALQWWKPQCLKRKSSETF